MELAERVGIAQSDLSKLERRGDVRVSTLEQYARGLGATLRLVFEFPQEEVEVDPRGRGQGSGR